jgi:hypothetical protein
LSKAALSPLTKKSRPVQPKNAAPAKIKIPRRLAVAVAECSRHRKSVSLLLYLKFYCSEGRFKNSKANQLKYAKLARISYNTYITRMVHLEQMGLVYVKAGYLYVKDWDAIAAHFKYKVTSKGGNYLVTPPSGKARLEDIIETCAMMHMTDTFISAFYYYLNRHPDIKENIKRVVGSTNRDAVHNSQLQSFLNYYRNVHPDDVFELNLFRADANVSYRYWSDFFGYNSRGGMAYKKRKLVRLGLISYIHRREQLHCHTTNFRRKWKYGSINYDPRVKTPVLTLCDAITFHSLNQAA